MDKYLSGDEVAKVAGKRVKVIKYSVLKVYNSIDQLFGRDKAVVILFGWEPNVNSGHWVVLTRSSDPDYVKDYEKRTGKHWNGEPIISYYNSYGKKIDYELSRMNPNWRKESGQDHDYLGELLNKYNGAVDYNEKQMQSNDKDDACCGRYAGWRARWADIPMHEYQRIMLSIGKPRDISRAIVKLTDPYL